MSFFVMRFGCIAGDSSAAAAVRLDKDKID